jgi:hypothetical protein
MRSALLAVARLLVGIGATVVVVNVLGGVLAVSGVGDGVETAVGDIVPASLALVGKEEVATVLPSEPSVHFLWEVPHLIGGLLVHPVVQGRIELIWAMGGDELRELALKAGEHIVELKGIIRVQVHTLGSGGEHSYGLAGPKTVELALVSNIGNELLGVLVKTLEVAFPLKGALVGLDVLKDDASPFGVGHALMNLLDSISWWELLNADISHILDVLSEILEGLVVSVVKRATIKAHNTSESVVMVDSGSSCDLSTETVTTNSGKSDLVLVRKSHDIVWHVL